MHTSDHESDKNSQSNLTLCSDVPTNLSIKDVENGDSLTLRTEIFSEYETTGYWAKLKMLAIPLLLGQFLAGLIALTAVCSTLLVNNNVSLPLAQNLPLYLLLSICYGLPRVICFIRNRQHHRIFSKNSNDNQNTCWNLFVHRYWWYLAAGIIDVHANWCIVSAYAYTNVTSVQLLDCLTIPTTVILSYIFLNYRYSWNHYFSLVLCLIGAIGMVFTDYFANPQNPNATMIINQTVNTSESSASHVIIGDILVIIGAIAYGFSNVMQQYLVVKYGIIDFLGFMGFSALVPITIYSFSIELSQIKYVFFDPNSPTHQNLLTIIGYFAGYLCAMFILYSIMPYVLARTSAILVNLSLLTADVYALLIGIFLFHYQFHALYIVCFLLILFGLCSFNIKQPTLLTNQTNCFLRFYHKYSPSRLCPKSN